MIASKRFFPEIHLQEYIHAADQKNIIRKKEVCRQIDCCIHCLDHFLIREGGQLVQRFDNQVNDPENFVFRALQ